MPISGNIYALQQPVRLPDPAAILKGVTDLRGQIRDEQAATQKAQDDATVRKVLTSTGGDMDATIQKLREVGAYGAADALEKADTAKRTSRANILQQQLANKVKSDEMISGYVSAALDDPTPETVDRLKTQLQTVPLSPDDPPDTRAKLIEQLGEFDPVKTPNLLQQWANGLLTEKQQDDMHRAHIELLYGKDPIRGMAGLLASTTDANDYKDEYTALMSTVHDKDTRAALKAKFPDPSRVTPETFKALQTGLSDLSMTDTEKTNRMQAETAAANAANAGGFTLGQGQVRFDKFGKRIAGVAPRPVAGTGTGDGTGTGMHPEGPHGEDYLKAIGPQEAQVVKALAEGRMPWPTGAALRAPIWAKRIDEVFNYDPQFDAAQANSNARMKVRNDFTSGASAKQINALNTVVGHLGTLTNKVGELNNTGTQFLNTVKNWLKTQGGSADVTNFNTAKEAVASELVRVWRQSGGAEQDIQDWKKTLDSSSSPAQLAGALTTIGDLLESKLQSMQDQYQQGMGTTPVSVITPEARKALDKLKGGGGGTTTAAPGAYAGEVRKAADGRLLGMVEGKVVELVKGPQGYTVK